MHRFFSALLALALSFSPFSAIAEDTAPESVRAVSVTVRDGDVVWSGIVSLPDSDTATTTLVASDGTEADITATSALAALALADVAADAFSISNLQYYASYGSFYVQCITTAREKCDSWQYSVGDDYPLVGMDQRILHDGDALFVYFGSPRRVTLSTTTIATGESFTATAEQFVPSSGTYAPAEGITLGVTEENPNDPYAPLVIATSSVDANGAAAFSITATGTYAVGIAEEYYFPSVEIIVTDPPEEPAEEAGQPEEHDSGGSSTSESRPDFDVTTAIAFLSQHQKSDGSFATPILTDWAASAFAATSERESGELLLRDHLVESLQGLTSATDYERRAMSLLALGIDPQSGRADTIARILSYFDGTQFGDPSLVNDDIFALIPLQRAGYSTRDDVIQKTVAFILDKQRVDGSWDGSIDLTAAAIQALARLDSLPGTRTALPNAEQYLRARQHTDGGFGNSYSTSWALQAFSARGMASEAERARQYIATLQASDGGLDLSSDERSRIWATEYAIPAMLGKDWLSLMHSFDKPQTHIETSTADVAETDSATTTEVIELPPLDEIQVTEILQKILAAPREAVESFTRDEMHEDADAAPAPAQVAAAATAIAPQRNLLSRAWQWITQIITALFTR